MVCHPGITISAAAPVPRQNSSNMVGSPWSRLITESGVTGGLPVDGAPAALGTDDRDEDGGLQVPDRRPPPGLPGQLGFPARPFGGPERGQVRARPSAVGRLLPTARRAAAVSGEEARGRHHAAAGALEAALDRRAEI
uniref:Uncharacterized protein n=1 Tax=Zea mays TaxID=4577 RepID=C4J2H9_MAIZE|nr:unknown [Zea mays]